MKFILSLFLILLISCASKQKPEKVETIANIDFYKKDNTNSLSSIHQKLKLDYILWGCACAPWIESKYREDTTIRISDSCFFLEPKNDSVFDLSSFDIDKHKLIVEGQFYLKKDYPKDYIKNEEQVEKARVFQYSKIKLISK